MVSDEIIKITVKNIIKISEDLLSDEVIKKEVKAILDRMKVEIDQIESKYQRNVIDPFSALFEQIVFNNNISKWKSSEISRQLQKTFGNLLGLFHQNLLCALENCENPAGGGVDLICEDKKIVAEIKNKWNSTNADSLAGSFDKLNHILSKKKYSNFTGYFVTIVPRKPKNYSEILVTTKNKKKSQYRKPKKNILAINSEFFYEKLTGKENVLKSIFYRLPNIFKSLNTQQSNLIDKIHKDKSFDYYLNKALKN